MAGPPPRRRPKQRPAPADQKTGRDPPGQAAARKRPAKGRKERLTKGQKAVRKETARRQRQAHQAGLRAVRRERLLRVVEWIWPPHTRDIGRGKAVLVLVLNVAPFPGLGTALYGQTERGLLQFALTFVFLIGWVWAITDGIRIVRRAYRGPDPRDARAAPRGAVGGGPRHG